jgi:DNA repair protein SbcD/Mre11
MRIVHTADWHLGDHLHGLDRTEDLRSRVAEVARICDERGADVVIIAGDVFSNHSLVSAVDMTGELEHILKMFSPFFQRGGTILAVTGNHDMDKHIEFIRAGMRLAAVPSQSAKPLAPGRMYLQNGPGVATLEAAGERIQFVFVPYPFAHRYADEVDDLKSSEDRNRRIADRVGTWVQKATDKPEFDKTLPSVLIAHLHVRGSATHSLYKISESDDVTFGADFIPSSWAYVALGHIHKPQMIGGLEHVRYPGPLDRLDFGERDDDRGVIVVDIGKQFGPECRTPPEWVPITPTPMHLISLTDTAEIEGLAEQYPDHATAIVKFTVILQPGGPSRDEVTQRLRKLFPRLADIAFERSESVANLDARPGIRSDADYRETVRSYLIAKLTGHPEATELSLLAETFLTQMDIQS